MLWTNFQNFKNVIRKQSSRINNTFTPLLTGRLEVKFLISYQSLCGTDNNNNSNDDNNHNHDRITIMITITITITIPKTITIMITISITV